MNKIYLTGDTHGALEIGRITDQGFPAGGRLDRGDYLIIAGDFGGLFDPAPAKNRPVLDLVAGLPFTVLWIDGNHENFDLLARYPVTEWEGGQAQKILGNCFHLCRGSVFDIAGRSFFCFGGGCSIDRIWRREGVSWWPEELPGGPEYQKGLTELSRRGRKVDYVISHAAPAAVMRRLFGGDGYGLPTAKAEQELGKYLDRIQENTEYRHWYAGHLHIDDEARFSDLKLSLVYRRIIRLA